MFNSMLMNAKLPISLLGGGGGRKVLLTVCLYIIEFLLEN